ncbi:hypothetical protein AOQ84DRAFT_387264, partial [Glonium stellatum]
MKHSPRPISSSTMAEIATIISLVSWGSRLALDLYKFGRVVPSATRDISRIAKTITLLSLTLKQIGATIKEDDTIPSPEAIETTQGILDQCQAIFSEIQELVPVNEVGGHHEKANNEEDEPAFLVQGQKWKWSLTSKARMDYLLGHLESLKLTLSVMLQTFYTAKIIKWSREHPAISPERVAESVQNEKIQMEILVIEQQMSLLSASKLFDELRRSEAFSAPLLITEGDSSKSVMPIGDQTKQIAHAENLSQYQETSLAKLDVSTPDIDYLIMVHQVSASCIEDMLTKWTRLRGIEARLNHAEREIDTQRKLDQLERRKSQQPTVESDDSDDQLSALPGIKNSNLRFAAPTPRRTPSTRPLFPDSPTMSSPDLKTTFGPTAPLSPASSQYGVSPKSSGVLPPSPQQSPRSSLSSLPARTVAASKTQHEDASAEWGIPWRLCLRTHYWEYVDGKVERTNSDYPPSKALNDRNASTEIMSTWVYREAIEEAGYRYETFKKERNDRRRTTLETCFSISQPLTFAEVERLVERTAEIYHRRQSRRSPSPKRRSPSPKRRSSSPKRRYSSDRTQTYNPQFQYPRYDDRSPSYSSHPPPLERATTSYFPPLPPPLTRATTFPGPDPAFPHSPTATGTTHAYASYPPTPQTPSFPPPPPLQ